MCIQFKDKHILLLGVLALPFLLMRIMNKNLGDHCNCGLRDLRTRFRILVCLGLNLGLIMYQLGVLGNSPHLIASHV